MKTPLTLKFGLALALVGALAACGGGAPDSDGIDSAHATPLLVRGRNAREVARVAERLASTGYDRVFVVTR